jgi:cysteine desulfurase
VIATGTKGGKMSNPRVYFDNSATTPLDSRVGEAMRPFYGETFGNPSSTYFEGYEAHQAVESARAQIAQLLGADPHEVVFTGSGSEADNTALGIVEMFEGKSHIITSAIEHPAVLETCRHLKRHRGIDITYLPVGSDGTVDPGELARVFRPETRLVSIMAANNVVGTIQPIVELARIAHEHGAFFHTDAVQAVGKLPIDVHRDHIDLLSLSAHKLNGPKGVGALIVRDGIPFRPLIWGGGQEEGRRSSTENVAGIVGLGKAAQIAREEMTEESARLVQLREKLITGIEAITSKAYVIGHRYRRLPGHLCLGFEDLEGEAIKLLLLLDEAGIAVSTGSACAAHHATEPSYILTAMGFDPVRARGSLRVTLGRFNIESDVEVFLNVLPEMLSRLKPIMSAR